MRLSMEIAWGGSRRPFAEVAREVRDLEQAGLDLVWVAEAYTFDAISRLGYLAAVTERVELATGIVNVYGRTPTTIAMTMAGLDYVSGGRAACGLGASGPQVIEGFHGVPWEKPLTRVRETIDVCRMLWRREKAQLDGQTIQVPLPEGRGTGLGKPLKFIDTPERERIPIWWAALMGRSVAAAAEHADGWLPTLYVPDRAERAWGEDLRAGLARRSPELGPLEIAAAAPVAIGEDLPVQELRDRLRPMLALYVGGMGARGKNFYNTLAQRYGFEAEAEEIQDLYLDGKKDEAAAKIPQAWLEEATLIGPASHVAERLAAYREAGVTMLTIDPLLGNGAETVAQLRELLG